MTRPPETLAVGEMTDAAIYAEAKALETEIRRIKQQLWPLERRLAILHAEEIWRFKTMTARAIR